MNLQRRLFAVTAAPPCWSANSHWTGLAQGGVKISPSIICPLVLLRSAQSQPMPTKCLWPALVNPDLEIIARNLTATRRFSAIFLRGWLHHLPNQPGSGRRLAGQIKKLLEANSIPPVKLTYNSAREGGAVECIVFPCILCSACCLPLCFWSNPSRETGTTTAWTEFKNDFEVDRSKYPQPLYSVTSRQLCPAQTTSKSRWLKPGALISTCHLY